MDISGAWKNIREKFSFSAKEVMDCFKLKQHKPWFGKECLKSLDRRKQAKLLWLHVPSQMNGEY
jgi:hypothetical protein